MTTRRHLVLGLAVLAVLALVAVLISATRNAARRWDPAKAKAEWYIENWPGPYRLEVDDDDPLSKYFVFIHKAEKGIYAMHIDSNDAFLFVDSSDPDSPGDVVVSVTWMEGDECTCTAEAFDLAKKQTVWRTRVKARPEKGGPWQTGARYKGDKTVLEYDGSGRVYVLGKGQGHRWAGQRWIAVLDLKSGKILKDEDLSGSPDSE
jgi:hypothetical protein